MNPKVASFQVSAVSGVESVESEINRGLENRNLNANAIISIVLTSESNCKWLTVFVKV